MITADNLTAFDVETNGVERAYALQPFRSTVVEQVKHGARQAWLTTCATAWYVEGEVQIRAIKYPDRETLRRWLVKMAEEKRYVVCWNTPFDVAWLIAMGLREEVLAVNWLDAMLILRHRVNTPRYLPGGNASFGLKATVETYLPEYAGYADDIDLADESEEGLTKLLEYNGRDSSYTLQLALKFISELTPEQLRCMLIEARSIPMVAENMLLGVNIDHYEAGKLGEKLDDDRKLAFVTLKVEDGQGVEPDVIASPQKLRKLLFETWNLPIQKLTEKGAASTDKEVLQLLAPIDRRAKLLHQYREATYNGTKFVDGPLNSVEYNGDGVTRPQPRLFGTYTGRMTYSSKTGEGVQEVPTGIAIHQWKRDKAFRKLILPPRGYKLIEVDFAGQEFRWMAVISGDQTMLQLCQPGEDAHAFMGSKIAHVGYQFLCEEVKAKAPGAKDKRQLGKVANLSLQYRTSPPTLIKVAAVQYELALDMREARAIHSTYLTSYPRVPQYWKTQIFKAQRDGFVDTLAGRRIHLGTGNTWKGEDAEGNLFDNSWGCESTAINFPIQGIGADQKYLAMLVLRDYLNSVDGRFYFELHDGIYLVVPDQYANKAVHEIRTLLSNLPYKKAWGVDLPIKFPVDAKIGDSWGDLEEVA